MRNTIIELEEKLRLAMIESDVETLDELIDESLVFVAPNGEVITKEMDLYVHKNELQTIKSIEQLEQTILIKENLAIVSTKAKLSGEFNNNDISGLYRYLRIWAKQKNSSDYKIISGSVVSIK